MNNQDNKKNDKDPSIKLDEHILEEVKVKIEKEDNKNNKDFFDYDKSILEFKPIGIVDDLYDKNKKTNPKSKKTQWNDNDFKDKNTDQLVDEVDLFAIKSPKINIIKDESIKKDVSNDKEEYVESNLANDSNTQIIDFIDNVEETIFEENINIEKDNEYDEAKIKSLIESALYVYGNEGVSLNDLKKLTLAPTTIIKKILKNWIDELEKDSSKGISIKNYGERYKFFTKPNNREELSRLITIKYKNPLSTKVMETLAIIAYNQPCTKSIIENIRGKDPSATIQKLVELGLVNNAGRGDGPGQPLLFTVSHKFYDIFGIKNVSDLPTINLEQPFQDDDVSFFDTTRYNN